VSEYDFAPTARTQSCGHKYGRARLNSATRFNISAETSRDRSNTFGGTLMLCTQLLRALRACPFLP